MRRTNLALIAILAGMLSAASSRADEPDARGPKAGMFELRLTLPGGNFPGAPSTPGIGILAGDPKTTFLMDLGGGVGYFLNDNLEVGGELALGMAATSNVTTFVLYLGPWVRYVKPLSGPLSWWGEGKLGLFYLHAGPSANETEARIGLSGGVDYNVSKNLALYGGLVMDFYVGNILVIPIGVTYGLRGYL